MAKKSSSRRATIRLVNLGKLFVSQAEREQRQNQNMNDFMRKETRRGETGPGAAARKIGRIRWEE